MTRKRKTDGEKETISRSAASAEDSSAQSSKYDCLKLSHQLCFPLYAVSKEIIRRYKPLLEALDLTYTQYIAMMVMWEARELNVKELGRCLYLDSGTLTPVLKKLEHKGYITRRRSKVDERNLIVAVTEKGMELREQALSVPAEMSCALPLTHEETMTLYKILHKMLDAMEDDGQGGGQA